ncbi:hypothetical protein OPKNFCMD_0637 [Methylobacterium crusticola]|uniref:DUF4169 family protein n=1 Tax=Methylobacterium crusticola TaxID=1697972 RepID=A0ABQ4QRR4_9HYPH|nr:DUF4169 family protein [Methylobacterium crusticola]GJD47924.1 hypothetical protein OPKNFCMD_0637 [Methylobacterium crusticola]
MAEIINLRQARKARERAARDRDAAENRAAFGRSKPAKTRAETREALDAARHEGHRLERPDPAE